MGDAGRQEAVVWYDAWALIRDKERFPLFMGPWNVLKYVSRRSPLSAIPVFLALSSARPVLALCHNPCFWPCLVHVLRSPFAITLCF